MLDPGLIDGVRQCGRAAHRCVESLVPGGVGDRGLLAQAAAKLAATKVVERADGGATGPLLDAALGVSLSLVGSDEERERLAALWSAGEREETGGGVRETR